MYKKLSLLLIVIVVTGSTLVGCGSFHYTKAADIRAACVDAAKLKMAHHSGNCKLLEEISFREHEKALAEGEAWIEAHNLNDSQIEQIRRGGVWIGMPAEAAKLAWGDPNVVNKGALSQQREEWIYKEGNYLSIDQGRVASIHN